MVWPLIVMASFVAPGVVLAAAQLIARALQAEPPAPTSPPLAFTLALEEVRDRLQRLLAEGFFEGVARKYFTRAVRDARYLAPFASLAGVGEEQLRARLGRYSWYSPFHMTGRHRDCQSLFDALLSTQARGERSSLSRGVWALRALAVLQLVVGASAFTFFSPGRAALVAVVALAAAVTAGWSAPQLREARGGWSALFFGTFAWLFIAIFHLVLIGSPDAGGWLVTLAVLAWLGFGAGIVSPREQL
jgi:hypothetical protein